MSKSAIRLIFECSCNRTEWGEILRAVGNTRELGHWNVANGVILSTSKETYPRWRSNQIVFRINENSNPKRIDELLTSSSTIEFKFVISKGEGLNPKWENIRKFYDHEILFLFLIQFLLWLNRIPMFGLRLQLIAKSWFLTSRKMILLSFSLEVSVSFSLNSCTCF